MDNHHPMALFRYAIWFILGWLVFYFVKRLLNKPTRSTQRPRTPPIDQMVRCATCGLHVPQAEAVQSGQRFYCCKEHRTNDSAPP
jgi:uncharacterized protein